MFASPRAAPEGGACIRSGGRTPGRSGGVIRLGDVEELGQTFDKAPSRV